MLERLIQLGLLAFNNMKDKKKLTYALLAGSLLVWGLVFYKLFSYIGGGDDSLNGNNKIIVAPHIIEKEESYILVANYRDPFLGKMQVGPGNDGGLIVKKRSQPKVVKEPEKPIDLSFIAYSGMITNPTSKKKVALITIKGKQSMVAEGEVLDEVTFVKNFKDSIQISYLGKIAYVKRF